MKNSGIKSYFICLYPIVIASSCPRAFAEEICWKKEMSFYFFMGWGKCANVVQQGVYVSTLCSDEQLKSPSNIYTLSSKQVVRIPKLSGRSCYL